MGKDRMPDKSFLKTLTLLYVEDDEDIRNQFHQFLLRISGTLVTAVDGEDGLNAFKAHRPDIVITDVLMPRMDGLTMAEEILKLAPSIPIIVVTAFDQSEYLMRAINIGIEKYVTKPVNSELLLECLLDCAHRLLAEEELKLKHLRQIQEAKSEYNETFAILSGGMAEDYSSLMQRLLGYATLAKIHLEPDSNSYDYIENIVKCQNEANLLGNNLNALGSFYTDDFECRQLMPSIITSVRHLLDNSTITLELDLPEDLPCIRFVEQQIKQVFESMAANAKEAMPSGGSLLLSVRLVEVKKDGDVPLIPGMYAVISVSDSGDGIDASVMQNIFKPYFSTKDRSLKRGTGLNLAMCRTVIMRHGGIITAESIIGRGTTFNVWLPAEING